MSNQGLPQVGKVVTAEVEHCTEGFTAQVELVAVNESDCNWRFADDNSELAYDWYVVAWNYKE